MGSGGHSLGTCIALLFIPYKICKESISNAVKCNRKSKDKCIWEESNQKKNKDKENKTLGYNH